MEDGTLYQDRTHHCTKGTLVVWPSSEENVISSLLLWIFDQVQKCGDIFYTFGLEITDVYLLSDSMHAVV